MSKRKWDNKTFIQAVNTSLSYAEVIRKLAWRSAGIGIQTGLKHLCPLWD